MKSPLRRRSRLVEAAVATAAAAAAVGLAWAAWATSRSPDLAGETRLRLLAAEVSDAVLLACERWTASPELLGGQDAFAWADGTPAPSAEPSPAPQEGDLSTFAALAAEAEREARIESSPARALVTLEEALEFAETPLERAGGLRRAIQLAVLAERPGDARRHWAAMRAELDGSEGTAETGSLLLWGALAAAPALPEEERRAAGEALGRAWVEGRLVLPAVAGRLAGTRVVLPARLEDLAAALGELGAGPDLDLDLARRRRRVLEEAWGDGLRLPAEPGRLAWSAAEDGTTGALLAARRVSGRGGIARLFERDELAATLARELPLRAGLPPAFSLVLGGDPPEDGERVLAPTPLPGTGLAFALWHEDPRAVVAAEGRRTRRTALGLAALAAFTALAGGLGFGALRRQRRLAELQTEFVAGVSHELRTPLASILLMAENLESGRVTDAATRDRYHGALLREAQRLRRLVDDVLDFARLERGEALRLAREEVPAAELWASIVAGAEELAARRGGTVVASASGLPAVLDVDAEALRRAVLNLVDNSLRHAGSARGEGPRQVELTARVGERFVLCVADRGRGVPEAERERIFEPFRQVDAGPAAARGAGLGLSLVREIARAHGGTARARARREGPGVAFEIELPLAGAEAEAEDPRP